jgi:hypothetical protein
MARARRPRPEIRPRIADDTATAYYIGKSPSWLASKRHELEQRYGFPPRVPVVGGNDLQAIDEWLDGLRAMTGGSTVSSSINIDELWTRATRDVTN